jgi:hypothetical protein
MLADLDYLTLGLRFLVAQTDLSVEVLAVP